MRHLALCAAVALLAIPAMASARTADSNVEIQHSDSSPPDVTASPAGNHLEPVALTAHAMLECDSGSAVSRCAFLRATESGASCTSKSTEVAPSGACLAPAALTSRRTHYRVHRRHTLPEESTSALYRHRSSSSRPREVERVCWGAQLI